MTERRARVQFSEDVALGQLADKVGPGNRSLSPTSTFNITTTVAKTIDQRKHISPPISPSKQKINIVFVADLKQDSITLKHRQRALECVESVCQEMEANLQLVQYEELDSNVPSALESFYNADASILDISIENQRNSLFYHLGVRESFSMKQNILIVANLIDSSSNDQLPNCDLSPLTHEAATQIKSLLPNYPLFVYFVNQANGDGDADRDCYVDQRFIDLTYSPGSDEQMDPSLPDFDVLLLDAKPLAENGESPDSSSRETEKLSKVSEDVSSDSPTTSQELAQETLLNMKAQLMDALKNVKWQAKAHMKDKFLADLKKAREQYQGEELYNILHKFRRRLDDPNMLSTEIVYQMLVSFKEIQDYDSMVKLVDDLSKFPNLIKITSSPQVVFHHAFALNRRHNEGDSDRALKLIVEALGTKEHQIPDSICLCGRIFKDRFIESSYKDRESLRNAISWYRKGFKISPNEYAAINLATLLYIAGHDFNSSNELKHLALVLNNLIGKKGPVQRLESYWDVATYFEFCLLANQFAKAIEAASCMFNLKPSKWNLKSTIGNIKLIYRFKPKTTCTETTDGGFSSSSTSQQETLPSPEEQIVVFWMEFFIDAVKDSCDDEIRFAALVLEQNNEYMPTNITMNLDAEEKSITISQMCINHMRSLDGCRKPHLWHIKATGIRGLSLYKRDERCVFLYVHDNSDDFQIFFPSESIRARFRSLVLSITGNRSIDMSANVKDAERKINFVYELDKDKNRMILGRGSKGVVYAARDVDTQTQIAIKEVPVKNIGEVQPLHEEIRLHSMLRHRNIVQYLGTSHEGDYFRIIMERVPGGSLSQKLQREWGPLNENVIAYFSRQILDGLQYLHRQKIVHRDIKGDNVLVNTYTGMLKISDFGTCKRLAAINPNTETFAGTVPFMAPELLDRGQRGYSMPADIWSFGCTVVEMASGKPPFIEIDSGAQVMFRVGFYKEHPEIPSKLSEKCKQFILRCFEPNTEHRATCEELLADPFLDEARPSSSAAVLRQTSGPNSPNKGETFPLIAISSASESLPANNPPLSKNSPSSSANKFQRQRHVSWTPERIGKRVTPTRTTTGELATDVYFKNADSASENILELSEEVYDDDDLIDDDDDDGEREDLSEDITLTSELDERLLATNQAPIGDKDNPDRRPYETLNNFDENLNGTHDCRLADSSPKAGDLEREMETNRRNYQTVDSCSKLVTKMRSSPERSAAQLRHRRRSHLLNTAVSSDDGSDLGRGRLIELNRQLDGENRRLWQRLCRVQRELRESLSMQLNDKQSQLDLLKKSTNSNG